MIGVIGCGNMGEALIKGLKDKGFLCSDVSEERLKFIRDKYKVATTTDNKQLAKKSDLIVLAVKPQDIAEVLSDIKTVIDDKKVLLSIAAGVTTSKIEKFTGRDVAVVRAMPNTPGLIGKGITAVCGGKFVKDEDKKSALEVLSVLGEVVETDESLMDAVTAISGSGPAYFFFLTEMLIKSGIEQGLREEIAEKLAVHTALGAASLMKDTKEDPAALCRKVISKGGTTEAAFRAFEQAGLGKILKNGIEAAINRSKELSAQ